MPVPLPAQPQLIEAWLQPLKVWPEDDEDIINATITAMEVPPGHWSLQSCILNRVRVDANWSRSSLQDCRIDSCDLSNADWSDNRWQRLVVRESKLTGFKLNDSELHNVQLTDCKAAYLQLQNCRAQKLVFDHCDVSRAYFNHAKLQNTLFKDCNLTEADFSGADITGSDLRGSRIDNIRIDVAQLRNVTVTADQALYLTGLMGLKIDV